MPLEIERKFLVRRAAWREAGFGPECGVSVTEVLQAYLPAGNLTVRIRRCVGQKDVLAIKADGEGIARVEIETMVSEKDADALFRMCNGALIHKLRWHISHGGLLWEVDKFLDRHKGLMLAEVELESEEQEISIPCWIGKEVTSDKRYSNHSLAIYGLSQIPKKKR